MAPFLSMGLDDPVLCMFKGLEKRIEKTDEFSYVLLVYLRMSLWEVWYFYELQYMIFFQMKIVSLLAGLVRFVQFFSQMALHMRDQWFPVQY